MKPITIALLVTLCLACTISGKFLKQHQGKTHSHQDPLATSTTDPTANSLGTTSTDTSGLGATTTASSSVYGKNSFCDSLPPNVESEFAGWTNFGTGGPKKYRNVSNGEVSYMYDALNGIFAPTYEQEANAAWQAFLSSVPSDKATGDRQINPQGDTVSSTDRDQSEWPNLLVWENIKNGAEQSGWSVAKGGSDTPYLNLLTKYSSDGQFLNFKEFQRMVLEVGLDDSGDCSNCLPETRKKSDELFNFIDCPKWGEVNSRMIHQSLPQIQDVTGKVSNNATNDFILKSGNVQKGSINSKEFNKGILRGYWERQVSDTGVDNHYKRLMDLRTKHSSSQ